MLNGLLRNLKGVRPTVKVCPCKQSFETSMVKVFFKVTGLFFTEGLYCLPISHILTEVCFYLCKKMSILLKKKILENSCGSSGAIGNISKLRHLLRCSLRAAAGYIQLLCCCPSLSFFSEVDPVAKGVSRGAGVQ